MPELPEVETIRGDLEKEIVGKKILTVEILKNKIVKGNNKLFVAFLAGKNFLKINRIGKLLYLRISGREKKYLLIHLKMTGQLVYKGKKMIAGGHPTKNFMELPNKHTRVIFTFSDKAKLYFNDMRQFGYLELVDEERLAMIKERYGIEPLQKNFVFSDFVKIFKKRSAPVKAVLLNQQLVSGIGNIYADEILFVSGVMPDRKALSLTDSELKKIFKAAEMIISKAIKERGTTFSDYRDARGQKGGYVKFLRVYGRAGKKCYKCGSTIKRKRVAGRGTSYCDKCQK